MQLRLKPAVTRIFSLSKRLIIGYWNVFKQPTVTASIEEIVTMYKQSNTDGTETPPTPEENTIQTPTLNDISSNKTTRDPSKSNN